MAADKGQTLNSDPVVNVFRTFSRLENQGFSARLEICDRKKFAERIINSASDFGCNFVIFPVALESNVYPSGWCGSVAETLFKSAHFTVGIFGDRGFGLLTSNIIIDIEPFDNVNSPLPETPIQIEYTNYPNDLKQTIYFPYFGGDDDDEALSIISYLTKSNNVFIEVDLMTDNLSQAMNEFTNNNTKSSNVHIKDICLEKPDFDRLEYLVAKFSILQARDLIVVGHYTYNYKKENDISLREYIDSKCHASFLLIRKAFSVLDSRQSISYNGTS